MLVELIIVVIEVYDEEFVMNFLWFFNNWSIFKVGWFLLIKYCGYFWISYNVLLLLVFVFVVFMVSNFLFLFIKRYGDSFIFKVEIIKSMFYDN